MKCRVCGATLRSITTDPPLKVSDRTIVVVKKTARHAMRRMHRVPHRGPVMAKVDELLSRVDRSMELEVVPFAA